MSGPIRVLVVDDDRGARGLHCGYVAETPGFAVAGTSSTGEEALAQISRGVDLILLDMRLPDISGIEVLHRLRTLGEGGPDVLVISSSRDQTTVRQALAAHVVGYLSKPFTRAALQDRLQTYRENRSRFVDVSHERPLGQGEIDRLLASGGIVVKGPGADRTVRLPKGLAEPTLARVLDVLDPVTPQSTRQVAAACGLSQPTAHRYLAHLVDAGVIDRSHRYGRQGRPQVLYRLAPSAPPQSGQAR
jgi:response regulator of citrate/malate metabolism